MRRIFFAALLFSMWSTNLHAQADFYKGKTIRVVIGYSAGGTNDLWARAIARFWGKYIPGNPDIIVQNMPVAATMIAANYIYGVGKSDGLTLGLLSPALFFNQIGGQKEVKFDLVTGYPGASEIDLAIEKGEVQCRAGTTSAFFGREPGRTWAKTGFVRILVIGGSKRDSRAPDVPTIWEMMERHKTPESSKRLATVLLSPGPFGRPIVGGPGIPADRVKILRDSFLKVMSDPELLAEAEKRGWEPDPVSGDKLEALAREVVTQPPDVIARMNVVLGK